MQRYVPLTMMECRAMSLWASGARNDDVAFALNTSSTAVRDMLLRILNKLDLNSRDEAIELWRGTSYQAALSAEHNRRFGERRI